MREEKRREEEKERRSRRGGEKVKTVPNRAVNIGTVPNFDRSIDLKSGATTRSPVETQQEAPVDEQELRECRNSSGRS